MRFQFHIGISDQDYLEFNKFVMHKTPYGKKQFRSLRIISAVIVLAAMLCTVWDLSGWLSYVIAGVFEVLVLIVVQLGLKPVYNLILSGHIKQMKKSGKMPYSPNSTMTFWDEYFEEATQDNKTEQKYSAVERVSIQEGKMVYLHINNLMAYIIPISAFVSAEQYGEFVDFIKTKCSVVDFY